LLQKLGQVEDTQLKEILFINDEENKKRTLESIVNRKRTKKTTEGFKKMIKFIEEFINESKNSPIKERKRIGFIL
jgi:16S rRNA C1402 N4-methylase RsmH